MDVLDFEEGPWTRLIEGDFQGFTVYIYQNPKKWALTVIFEKENDQITHVITQIYAPFIFDGSIHPFSEKIGLDSIVIEKNVHGESYKYIVVCSGIEYTHYSADEFKAAIKKQVSRLKTSVAHVLDVAKKINLTLTPINTSGKIEQANFFGEPLLLPILATKPNIAPATEKIGEILLGSDSKGAQIKEPATYFMLSLVTGKDVNTRLKMAQNIAEGALYSAIPVLIFDPDTAFLGLGKSADNKKELDAAHIDMQPTAFPINTATDYTKIDINSLPKVLLAELGGWNLEQASEEIDEIIQDNKGKIKDIPNIIELLDNKPNPTYYTRQAIRMLLLLNKQCGAAIDGNIELDKAVKPWVGSLGSANIISLSKFDKNVQKYVVYSVLSKILEDYTQKGATQKVRLMVLIPNADTLLSPTADGYIREIILALKEYGVAVILLAEEDIDVHQDVLLELDSKINCVNKEEAVIQIKGKKPIRFKVRPLLSRFFGI